MNKLKIYLADLTHVNSCVSAENIPLNIGLLKSYSEKSFQEKVDITLFKYPEPLLDALKNDPPDILGSSNYIWNARLSEWACAKAKQVNPDILTIKGGWNFPIDPQGRIEFLQENPATDIYCFHEAEKTFANILDIFIHSGKSALFRQTLPGSVYLNRKEKTLVTGSEPERMRDLDEIPSPYTNGILDEFFDGKLTPVIETTRGCPFQCNFCNSAVKNYNKIARFTDEYVLNELNYIGKKVHKAGAGPLIIADTNFGMYARDPMIADEINRVRDEVNWPNSILLTTGKRNIEGVLKTVKSLKDLLVPSISVQSMNFDTLDEIKRANLSMEAYRDYAAFAEKEGITIYAELILTLPKETLETYWNGLIELLEAGARKVITYTLQMNYGTVYRDENYLKEHGYTGKYRLIPSAFGMYGGDRVLDMERVAVSNKYLPFEDYLECRKIAFIVELAYNNYCFSELIKYLEEKGWGIRKYLTSIRENISEAPGSLLKIFEDYIEETKGELFDTEDELYSFYSQPDNFEKLQNGNVGRNVIFTHKGTVYGDHSESLITFIINSVEKKLSEDKILSEDDKLALKNIEKYLKGKFHGFLDRNSIHTSIPVECDYDIQAWYESDKNSFHQFKKPIKYQFIYTNDKKTKINEMFKIYGNLKASKTKIIAKTMLLQNLLRQPAVDMN